MATDMKETMVQTTNNYDGTDDDDDDNDDDSNNNDDNTDDTVNDYTEMHNFSRLTAAERVACNFCSRRLYRGRISLNPRDNGCGTVATVAYPTTMR